MDPSLATRTVDKRTVSDCGAAGTYAAAHMTHAPVMLQSQRAVDAVDSLQHSEQTKPSVVTKATNATSTTVASTLICWTQRSMPERGPASLLSESLVDVNAPSQHPRSMDRTEACGTERSIQLCRRMDESAKVVPRPAPPRILDTNHPANDEPVARVGERKNLGCMARGCSQKRLPAWIAAHRTIHHDDIGLWQARRGVHEIALDKLQPSVQSQFPTRGACGAQVRG
jgi:hypothetical protein